MSVAVTPDGQGGAAERARWHPVIADEALPAQALRAVTLLGEDLVLWRDTGGAVQVLRDQCPHRGTRLSIGRVVDDHVECPYHGWRFGGGGRCVFIPATPDFQPTPRHAACAHEATVAHGLVWVRLQPGDTTVPPFDGDGDPRVRSVLCGPYDVATSAPRIVENFLDLSHFGFVHEGWLGDRGHTALDDHAIEPTPRGFAATGCRAWQPRSNAVATEGSWVDYRYELRDAYTATLTKLPQAQDGYRDLIGLFVCPVGPERSRVWFRLSVTDLASSDDDLRAFQHTIFTQDQPILESQRPRCLPLAVGAEAHHVADRSSAAYRRWLREHGITFGTC